jgi:hypothetical protein
LNVPQEIDNNTGKYIEKEPEFQRWQDSRDIDFNCWWQIEVLDNPNQIRLRSFNSRMYLQYGYDLRDAHPFDLVEDCSERCVFLIESIGKEEKNASNLDESNKFRIQIKEDIVEGDRCCLCMENKDENAFDIKGDTNFDKRNAVLGTCYQVDLLNAFKFIIPKEEEYLELTFCIDARQCIEIVALKLQKSQNVSVTLEKLKESFSKVLLKVMDFMLNQLQGRIRVDSNIGEIIPHRQAMVAKVGILDTVLYILTLIQKSLEEANTDEYLEKMAIPFEIFNGHTNFLEVIIKTLHVSIINSQFNIIRLIKNINIVQNFIFVKGCPSFLIDIFKDSNFELNKREIHSEQLYRRIYEIDRFEEVIKYLVKKLIAEDNYIYLVILRKMCIIDGNPLPMVQKSIFELLYQEMNGFQNKYSIIGNKGGNLLISKSLKGAKGYAEETPNEFFNRATVEQENFLLEQLSLEAGL